MFTDGLLLTYMINDAIKKTKQYTVVINNECYWKCRKQSNAKLTPMQWKDQVKYGPKQSMKSNNLIINFYINSYINTCKYFL